MARAVPPKLLAGVVVLAGLAIGSAIDSRMPSTTEVLDRPFPHDAVVGQPTALRTAEVTVTGVSSARAVHNLGRDFSSEGVWLVLDLRILALHEPTMISGMELHAVSGAVYGGAGDAPTGCGTAQPGIPQDCRVAWEVDPADLPGLVAHVPASGDAAAPGDDVAVVDLGLTPTSPAVTSPADSVEVLRATFGGAS